MSGGSNMLLRKIYPVCCKQDLDIGQHQWLDWYMTTLISLMLFSTMISFSEGNWQVYFKEQHFSLLLVTSSICKRQNRLLCRQGPLYRSLPTIVLSCGKLLREAKKWYSSTLLLEAWGCVCVWVRLDQG